MRKVLALAALVTVALAGCGGSAPPAGDASAAGALETYATTRQVMLGLTIPASDFLFQIGDNEPADDLGWERVVATALVLAESGQLLTTGARRIDDPEWDRWARALIDASKVAADAGRAKDVEAVLDAGNGIYETCDGCHQKFMPARLAEEAAAAGGATPAPQE